MKQREHQRAMATVAAQRDQLQEDVEALRRQVRELEDRLTDKSNELYDYQQFVIERYGATHEGSAP